MFATRLAKERAEGIPLWRFLMQGTGKDKKVTCADVARVKRHMKYDPLGMSKAAFDLIRDYDIKELPEGTGPKGIILRCDILKII
jgi:hypothetical protein